MIAALWAHLHKDLRIEWRAKDAMQSMLFYALLVVVLFSLAFDPTRETSRQYAGGVLCVAVLFAAVQALNQAWSRELRGNVLDAQRMSPAPASALYLAKVLANFVFVLIVEAVLTPVFVIFYNLHPLGNGWLFFVILPLGSWALVANGVFFAALSLRARSRELLLPLVLFPIFIPALLAMVLAATDVLTGESDPGLWVKVLVGYDIIFTVLSLLLVLLSATSFSRALTRMYAKAWSVRGPGWRSPWRWIAAIVAITACTVTLQAVHRAASGNAAAASNEKFSGSATTFRSGTTTYSA